MFRTLTTLSFAALLTSCASSGTKPDDMSAQEHRAAAEKERQEAAKHAQQYDPKATGTRPIDPSHANHGGAELGDAFWDEETYNPTASHKAVADKHEKLAEAHEKAAAALESFEEATCKSFPPATRKVCPLNGTVTRAEEIDGGVRLFFAPSVPIDAVVAHVKCHFGFARVNGYDGMSGCPLYVKGVQVKAGEHSIDLLGADDATVSEIRARLASHVQGN